MKNTSLRILWIALALSIPAIVFSQTQQKPATNQQQAKTQAPAPKLTNETDSSQYILGAYLGQYLNANGISITKPEIFLRGMDDALGNRQLMVNADSIPRRMNEYMSRMVMERNRALEKQLFDNVKGQPGVGTLPNGVCYVIAKAGTGTRPGLSDSISMHVKGYLPEGTLFEDTYSRNTPISSTPANMIAGLREVLQIMPAGSIWRVFIPSSLAYGAQGIQGVIPPYSAVAFDVELLNVKK